MNDKETEQDSHNIIDAAVSRQAMAAPEYDDAASVSEAADLFFREISENDDAAADMVINVAADTADDTVADTAADGVVINADAEVANSEVADAPVAYAIYDAPPDISEASDDVIVTGAAFFTDASNVANVTDTTRVTNIADATDNADGVYIPGSAFFADVRNTAELDYASPDVPDPMPEIIINDSAKSTDVENIASAADGYGERINNDMFVALDDESAVAGTVAPYDEDSTDAEGRLILLSRTLSGLIDLFLIVLFSGIFLGMADYFTNAPMLNSMTAINFSTLFLIIYFIYAIFFLRTNKQTIGMMATNLRVVGMNKKSVSMLQVVRRSVLFLVSLFGLGIGLLAGVFSRKCLCMHDRVSKTRVIRI